MNNLPDGPRGQALAVAIAFLIIAIFYLAIVDPLLGLYQSGQDELQGRRDLEHRLQASADQLPKLREASERLGKEASEGSVLLIGNSPTVAAAQLQSTLKEIVEKGGAHLGSSEILAPEAADSFQRIGLHASFSGDLTLLTAVLRGIETSHPAMFVDNVEIRGGSNSGDDAQSLSIAFDVYGFRSS